MTNPKIYLALDTCFAIKRWVEPKSWIPLIRDLGFSCVEASFDNEMDFLYSPAAWREQWYAQVAELEQELDMRVVNFFTGYQTYRTAGLGHPDPLMADHLLEHWMLPAIRELGSQGRGIGFSFHAITDDILQDPEQYRATTDQVTRRMAEIARCAAESGGIPVCVEAMYAPHQPPWTIEGTRRFLADCCGVNGDPLYTTVDVGHMTGQRRFFKPSQEEVERSLQRAAPGDLRPNLWLGSTHTFELWRDAAASRADAREAAKKIAEDMDRYDYLFSFDLRDCDPYAWLEELACYSPIIHMQQTDGITASHAAFTPATNKHGIITGERLLKAIAESYRKPEQPGMPPRAEKLYLSFEIFAANAEYRFEILEKLEETARYWRQFVPRDGMPLEELLAALD